MHPNTQYDFPPDDSVVNVGASSLPALEEEIERQVPALVDQAAAIIVRDQETLTRANDFSIAVKRLRREIEETFDPIIEAAHRAHKVALDKKRKYIEPVDSAERTVKAKIGSYLDEQERIRKEAERRACEAEQEKIRAQQDALRKEQEAQRKAEAERRGLFFQVGFELRYSKLYAKIKEWADAGLLGEIVNTHCLYGSSAWGKGIWRKVRLALHFNSVPTRALADVTAKPEPSCSILASIVSN